VAPLRGRCGHARLGQGVPVDRRHPRLDRRAALGPSPALAADVYLLGDAGGAVPQWRRIDGAANVARLLASLFAPFARIGCVVEPREVNGQPAAIVRDRDAKVLGIWALDIVDGRIQAIRALLNPEKLAHLGPTAGARAIIHEAYQGRRAGPGPR
jgi:RNA polymerase sigma-70 factor, ECF subfamily